MKKLTIIFAILFFSAISAKAAMITVDFDRNTPGWGGTIIDDEYSQWFTVSATNPNRSFGGYAIIWDAETHTDDSDLLTAELDALIVSERNPGSGTFRPDDEAGTGATILFDFTESITDFTINWVDLDEPNALGNYSIAFLDELGNELFKVTFETLNGLSGGFTLANNSLNLIDPKLAGFDFSQYDVDKALVTFGGSGGIGSIQFGITSVPEPTTMVLMGLGLAGIAGVRRLKR
mgnify:CR=1 FL=1